MKPGEVGVVVNPDGHPYVAVFEGARVRVIQRLYFPDALIVECIDAGPGWVAGHCGEIPIRYFEAYEVEWPA